MNKIEDDILVVRQLVDFSEMILPIEARNRYEIYDAEGNQKYFAYEVGGRRIWAFLLRSLLSNYRPFTMKVVDRDQREIVSLERPFRFYFHGINIYQNGQWIGCVRRKFNNLNKHYNLFDHNDNFMCEVKGPIWKPWTFNIIRNSKVYGKIKKAWRGFFQEALTDSDNFGVQFPDGASNEDRKILLATVFLLDFIYFEDNKGIDYFPNIRT